MPRDDLRNGRFSEPGRLYHITTVTADYRPVFQDFWVARQVVAELRHLHDHGILESLAFVVMPEHLHWLVRLPAGSNLSQGVRLLKGRTAHRVNAYCGRRGRLWQRGFYDHALRRDEDVARIARYIVANPIRRGLVRRVGDYPLWDAVWL